jgi:hypothetical protein
MQYLINVLHAQGCKSNEIRLPLILKKHEKILRYINKKARSGMNGPDSRLF